MSDKGFFFRESWRDAMTGLSRMDRLGLYEAVIEYGLKGTVGNLSPLQEVIFKLIRREIDYVPADGRTVRGQAPCPPAADGRAVTSRENGKLGGRPRKCAVKPNHEPKKPNSGLGFSAESAGSPSRTHVICNQENNIDCKNNNREKQKESRKKDEKSSAAAAAPNRGTAAPGVAAPQDSAVPRAQACLEEAEPSVTPGKGGTTAAWGIKNPHPHPLPLGGGEKGEREARCPHAALRLPGVTDNSAPPGLIRSVAEGGDATKDATLKPLVAGGQIDTDAFRDYYNAALAARKSGMVCCRILNEARRRNIRARFREYGIGPMLEVLGKALDSDFLNGRTGGDRCWRASLDWLMRPANFAKVYDGNYDNSKTGNKIEGNGNTEKYDSRRGVEATYHTAEEYEEEF